jgi:hypothetical protein
MKPYARFLPWVVLALAVSAAAGCGLFSTRAPTPPNGGQTIAENFTVPESTLATMQRAMHAKSPEVYGHCLADSSLEQRDFHSVFDPADLTAAEQTGVIPPPDWNRDLELSFFPQFAAYNPNAAYDLYFKLDTSRGGIENIGGATQKVIYHEIYRVRAGASPVCAGAAGITLERVGASTQFKVTFWEDRRDTANVRTMGAARLNGR